MYTEHCNSLSICDDMVHLNYLKETAQDIAYLQTWRNNHYTAAINYCFINFQVF